MTEKQASLDLSKLDMIDLLKHPGITGPMRVEIAQIADLCVEDAYQRDLKTRFVNRLHRNYASYLAQAIVVAERPDGTKPILDGQQRVDAASKAGAKNILAIIIPVDGNIATESSIYERLNEERLGLTPFERYKSALVSGKTDAVLVSAAADKVGYSITKTPAAHKGIRCIQCLRKWARQDPEILNRMMEICAEIYQGAKFDNRTVTGVASLLSYLKSIDWNAGRTRSAWRLTSDDLKKLRLAGPTGLDQCIRAAELFHGKGGNNVGSVQANGIIKLLNSGRRQDNRIPSITI